MSNFDAIKVTKHSVKEKKCSNCLGRGQVRRAKNPYDPYFDTWKTCDSCVGTGIKKIASPVNL